jgi:hypothetical protein
LLSKTFRFTFKPHSAYRKLVKCSDRKKIAVSDGVKSKIFADSDSGVEYADLSKKYGLSLPYL